MVIGTFKPPKKRHYIRRVGATAILIGVLTPFAISFNSNAIFKQEPIRPVEVEVIEFKTTSYNIKNEVTVVTDKPTLEINSNLVDMQMFTSDVVNLRAGNGLEYEVLETLSFATPVYVEYKLVDCDWYKVHYDDVVGYIHSDYLVSEMPLTMIESTAYWDEYNRDSASGRELIEGKSLAGKIEWLGKTVELYECRDDGSVGSYIGVYQFDDTGYGEESGVGTSVILSDRTIGTIENGTCIDIYMEEYMDCIEYGRNDIYMRFVD